MACKPPLSKCFLVCLLAGCFVALLPFSEEHAIHLKAEELRDEQIIVIEVVGPGSKLTSGPLNHRNLWPRFALVSEPHGKRVGSSAAGNTIQQNGDSKVAVLVWQYLALNLCQIFRVEGVLGMHVGYTAAVAGRGARLTA